MWCAKLKFALIIAILAVSPYFPLLIAVWKTRNLKKVDRTKYCFPHIQYWLFSLGLFALALTVSCNFPAIAEFVNISNPLRAEPCATCFLTAFCYSVELLGIVFGFYLIFRAMEVSRLAQHRDVVVFLRFGGLLCIVYSLMVTGSVNWIVCSVSDSVCVPN